MIKNTLSSKTKNFQLNNARTITKTDKNNIFATLTANAKLIKCVIYQFRCGHYFFSTFSNSMGILGQQHCWSQAQTNEGCWFLEKSLPSKFGPFFSQNHRLRTMLSARPLGVRWTIFSRSSQKDMKRSHFYGFILQEITYINSLFVMSLTNSKNFTLYERTDPQECNFWNNFQGR